MDDSTSPVIERRRLAGELRRLRSERNRTIQEIAELMDCSAGKISRIETGSVGVSVSDVRNLLDIYDVHGKQRENLLDLARQSHRRAWWHRYAGALPPESIRFFGLEDGATKIDEYSGLLVPGLLQTDDYLRALIGSVKDDPQAVELRTELRKQRREILTKKGAPEVNFVLHEAALTALFGGPAVMATQLDHLAEMSKLANLTIQLIPLTTGEYAAAGAAFTIFGFGVNGDPPIVHIEQLTSSLYREHPRDIAAYSNAFAELRLKALGARDSRKVITERAAALKETQQD